MADVDKLNIDSIIQRLLEGKHVQDLSSKCLPSRSRAAISALRMLLPTGRKPQCQPVHVELLLLEDPPVPKRLLPGLSVACHRAS